MKRNDSSCALPLDYTLKRILLFTVLFVALGATNASADYHDRVAATDCHPAPVTAWAGRSGNWRAWENYIALCPVRAEDGWTVLFVLTPRIDDWGG